jgi:hypothetical protein
MASNEGEISYVRDHLDSQAKGTNYLLAGHGAILVACLTIIKDGRADPPLKGLGLIGATSAIGLFFAALACAVIIVVRSMKIKNLRGHSKTNEEPLVSSFKFFQIASLVFFLIELLMVGWWLAFLT